MLPFSRRAWQTPRAVPFSEEEKQAARYAIQQLSVFLRKLWATQQHGEELMDVLERSPNADSRQLFSIRHLIRRFRDESRQHFASMISEFSQVITTLNPFLKDTETNRIREDLMDAMQQLSNTAETFLETFEDFNAPDQIQRLKSLFQKIKQIDTEIEAVIKGRLSAHFNKDILQRRKISDLRSTIKRRARLIAMMG